MRTPGIASATRYIVYAGSKAADCSHGGLVGACIAAREAAQLRPGVKHEVERVAGDGGQTLEARYLWDGKAWRERWVR